jgi:hypothetical protein
MKYLSISLIVLVFASCGLNDRPILEKKWKVVELQLPGFPTDAIDQMISSGIVYEFEFNKTFTMQVGADKHTGTYEMDLEAMEISTTDDNTKETEVSQVLELSDTLMIWKKGDNKMVFHPAD